ncbi:hypothetical protein Tco_1402636 [Tanacetum coccineum]
MTTLAEHMIVAGADNRPPMLEKTMYNSWQNHMLLYIKGKEHDRMILNSILHGPLVYGTIEVDGVTRPKTYEELTDTEKLQDDCDKYCSSRSSTRCVLSCQPSRGMKMQQVQVNTKFLNSLPTEWSKFVTDVKLARNMHTAEYDHLYAYLSQHEAHATEVRLMRERFPNSLALGQSFVGMGSKSNATSSVINKNGRNNAVVQARVVSCYNCQGEGHMERQCTQPKRPRNSTWFKEKILLVQAQEAGQVLDEEQLAFLADPRVAKIQDTQTTITHNVAFQTDDLDAFDSDCDEAPGAKAVLNG